MKVNEIMNTQLQKCGQQTDLNTVLMMMWNNDCGCIPIVDDGDVPVGMLTDRDIAMYSALNHVAPWDLSPSDVTSSQGVITCNSSDDVQAALELMMNNQIRRLPVVNSAGVLEGILSMKDAIEAAKNDRDCKKSELSSFLLLICYG